MLLGVVAKIRWQAHCNYFWREGFENGTLTNTPLNELLCWFPYWSFQQIQPTDSFLHRGNTDWEPRLTWRNKERNNLFFFACPSWTYRAGTYETKHRRRFLFVIRYVFFAKLRGIVPYVGPSPKFSVSLTAFISSQWACLPIACDVR